MTHVDIRAPQQTRSRQTLERILSSSTVLVAEKSYADVSIAEITRKASVSVGAFYSRFKNKEALFVALQGRLGEETQERLRAAMNRDWAKSSLQKLLRHVVENNVELYEKYRGVLAAIHLQTRVLRPVGADAARRSYNDKLVSQIEELILKKRNEVVHHQPRVAIRVAIACMSAMLRDAIVFGDTSLYPKPGDPGTVTRQVTEVMYRHLAAATP